MPNPSPQYRVNTYTSTGALGIWYVLELSLDGGATWAPVQGSSRQWAATNGYVASKTQATIVAQLATYHNAVIGDVTNPANWTTGPVVAGPE